MKINVSIEVSFDVEVTHYRPESPAPDCDDPSNPLYADPGQGEEVEWTLDESALKEQINEKIADYIREYYAG